MHQSIDRKKKIFFYSLLLIFLSTTNNKFFTNYKYDLLRIKELNIEGLDVGEKIILDEKLNYLINQNIFFINKSLIEKKINSLNFIEYIEVKKIYPSKLLILTTKAQIIAKTLKENTEYFIGSNGKFIPKKKNYGNENLPLIFGDFKTYDFLNLNKFFIQEGFKPNQFEKFFYHKNKRWDVKINENLLVKLPRKGTLEAIKKLKIILESMENSKYKIVDLRVPNQIILN